MKDSAFIRHWQSVFIRGIRGSNSVFRTNHSNEMHTMKQMKKTGNYAAGRIPVAAGGPS
jgi:hypothetical protein